MLYHVAFVLLVVYDVVYNQSVDVTMMAYAYTRRCIIDQHHYLLLWWKTQ